MANLREFFLVPLCSVVSSTVPASVRFWGEEWAFIGWFNTDFQILALDLDSGLLLAGAVLPWRAEDSFVP